MMPSPDLERFAGIVAENVVCAIERVIGERLEPEERRHHVVSALMRGVLVEMPTGSGLALALACNRVLSDGPDRGFILPRVVAGRYGGWGGDGRSDDVGPTPAARSCLRLARVEPSAAMTTPRLAAWARRSAPR